MGRIYQADGEPEIALAVSLDPGLFTAFGLLNSAGYNTENGWRFHQVRKAVRLKLAHSGDYWREQFSEAGLMEPALRAGGAMVMDIIPLLSLPPDFIIKPRGEIYSTPWQRESEAVLQGIDQWLRRFYEEEAIDSLWSEHLEAYQAEGAKFDKVIQILPAIARQFSEPLQGLGLRITLMPNLLDAKGRGYSLSSDDSTWLFFGPLEEGMVIKTAIHELLHRWVDRAIDAAMAETRDFSAMFRAKAKFPIVAVNYPDLPIWASEIVVRAATMWFIHKMGLSSENPAEMLALDEHMGFLHVQEVFRHFEFYSTCSASVAVQEAIKVLTRRLEIE